MARPRSNRGDHIRRSGLFARKETTPGWIVLRSAIALAAACLIVVGALVAATGGSHNNMNAGVVLGIALALLPAGIYGFRGQNENLDRLRGPR